MWSSWPAEEDHCVICIKQIAAAHEFINIFIYYGADAEMSRPLDEICPHWPEGRLSVGSGQSPARRHSGAAGP